MKTVFQFAFLTILSAFASCSVLEDRSECPNIVNVSIDDRQEERPALMKRKATVTLRSIGGDDGFRSSFTPSDYPAGYGMLVPKGSYNMSLVSGADAASIVRDAVRFTGGKEADSLFVTCLIADCLGEETFLKALLFKQFSTLRIILSNLPENVSPQVSVDSGWNGLNIFSLDPVTGGYVCRMREQGGGIYEARIPRSGGGPLNISIGEGDGMSGEKISYDIFDAIVSMGYDWKAPSLSDITVTLDYMTGTVQTLTVIGWDETLIEAEI